MRRFLLQILVVSGLLLTIGCAKHTADVRWSLRPGHHDDITTEDTAVLRRVHESEEGMATP